ncbi:MAG: crotonase [Chloroflexi bacterium]|jgi:enoyl-CoA hydratase|nr:crotonase [Chloroflexota bacterium]MCH2524295.1 enoyl-CoA hydratase-related protein [Dehalococcoidia bacterium]|tara:strand:- start:15496 stop:16299 length:804 start_codon:yes stop_codon:yes gene_type:complete
MTYKEILYSTENRIATLTLNCPEKLNAMGPVLLAEFEEAIKEFNRDDQSRVLVIRGAGRAFSAGYAIGGGDNHGSEQTVDEDRDRLEETALRWLSLWESPKPIISMVHGYCLAGASMLAVMADLTFVADDAKIGFPSLPIGSGDIETFWYWFVGPKRTKEIGWLLGTTISGKQAQDWGFANESFAPEDLETKTYEKAQLIARLPLSLLNLKKKSVNRIMEFQGFRAAVLSGSEWDAVAHATNAVKEMQGRMAEGGMKGAIQWFNTEA